MKKYTDYPSYPSSDSGHYGLPIQELHQRTASKQNIPKIQDKRDKSKELPKQPFIQPGKLTEKFEDIISSTVVTENQLTTFLTAKALRGPMLAYASQQQYVKKPSKNPSKQLPQIPKGIAGSLEPHLIGYSTITHEGIYRKTNDDEIAIYLEQNAKWFSLYDGHGGNKCSQFLKQYLHEQFFSLNWKKDIPNALRQAFVNAQEKWKKNGDKSGSCALVAFIYNNTCYVANLGDSRAVLASGNNSKCYQITKDHKPSNPQEQKRVMEAGGKIYQTTAITVSGDGQHDMIVGPLRVFPGRLSITRTFGDFEAKDPKQGNPNVVICQPQITSFEIDDHDMIIMGSDGIWDKLDNSQAVQVMSNLSKNQLGGEELLRGGAENILQQAMKRGSTDNVSLIIIGLNDPTIKRQPKKGNENIKIMGSLTSSNTLKKKDTNTKQKQNSNPERIKEIDTRIQEINRNASRVLQQSRR